MVQLTRLNNSPLLINSDLIKWIENAPDTVLTLVTGEKIVVLESSKQVLDKIVEFRRKILTELPVQVSSAGPTVVQITPQSPFSAEKSEGRHG
jgi:flagellar protein FlbD